MSSGATDVGRIPRARGAMVWEAAAEEYRRFVALLRQLDAADWSKPTDCTRWDVRQVALHILGATHANASPRELVHQFRTGLPLNRQIESHHWVDGVNELQVREREHLGPGEERTGPGPRPCAAGGSHPHPCAGSPFASVPRSAGSP